MHEQSETIQLPDGRWINVYGKATPQRGQRLPDTPDYSNVDDAVKAAVARSQAHGMPQRNGLLDFLQAASNSAASNVSGPVDLVGLGLRKLGIPVPEDAVLGSRWMERQGLTSPVPQNAGTLAGETLGMLAPLAGTTAGAKAVASGLNRVGENAAIPRQMGTQRGAVDFGQAQDLSGTAAAQADPLADVAAAAAKPMDPRRARAATAMGVEDPYSLSAQGVDAALRPKGMSTVMRPKQIAYPGIYDNPRELVSRAKVAPEDPLLKRLFGVTRDDLYEIGGRGTRAGNVTATPYKTAKNPKGAAAAEEVMNPRNTQRMIDIISEARQRPELFKGMSSWYTMDPLFDQFKRLYGKNAVPEYERFNTLTGMASPGSEVLSELNRGTAANWLDKQGRFSDFMDYGGLAGKARGPNFPADMAAVTPHPYHKTAQGGPMGKYLSGGVLDMKSAKVPSYIRASGVPETGFQTAFPVGDAHWSRLVGLPDTRAMTMGPKGIGPSGVSASVPEMTTLTPWWQKLSKQAGVEPVPGQAVVWGGGANATGVTSPIGAPKLELLAQQIGKTARRLGISPEDARDMVLMGKTHAGKASPGMLGATAAGAGAAAALGQPAMDKLNELIGAK